MNRAGRIALIVLVAGAAAGAGVAVRHNLAQKPLAAPASPTAVERLYGLSLPDVHGDLQPLSRWRGKVLVANFWATWCPPCRREIPDFSRLSRSYADKGVQFVGISIDNAQNVAAFRNEFDVPYPLLVATPETLQLAADFGNTAQGLPFTVVLDREGKLIESRVGVLSAEELEGKIRQP